MPRAQAPDPLRIAFLERFKTMAKTEVSPSSRGATADDVRHVAGPVADATVSAVLKSEPSMEDLEVAASYLRGDGSKVDRLGHPLSGKVAQVCDILSADALYAEVDEG
jgi:hypothetical protein